MTSDLISAELAECEAIIERGMTTFLEVGGALTRVRDRRLYRQEYRDFETYCQTRWSLSRSRAYQLMDAADVVDRMSTIVDTPVPVNEGQARQLIGLPTETAAQVMQEAHEATGGKPTATVIREVRERVENPIPEPVLSQEDCEALDDEAADELAERIAAELAASDRDYAERAADSRPKPAEGKPNRKPLPDAFWRATFDLGKEVTRIEKFAEDDRFSRNADQIKQSNLQDLIRARDALQRVIDKLNSQGV